MKKALFALLLLCLPLIASAQQERDFATQYMLLYAGQDTTLVCQTISPDMMKHMINREEVEQDDELKSILRQIRTLQVVRAEGETPAQENFEKAVDLAKLNTQRYKLYAYGDTYQIYLRKKGDIIVELVHINLMENAFCIINLTGYMTKDFIKLLSH